MITEKGQQFTKNIGHSQLKMFILQLFRDTDVLIDDERISFCKKKLSSHEAFLNANPDSSSITSWCTFSFPVIAISLLELGWDFDDQISLPEHMTDIYEPNSNIFTFTKDSKMVVIGCIEKHKSMYFPSIAFFNSNKIL